MRDDRAATARRWGRPLVMALGTLSAWLVIQNGVLLLVCSWPALPAAWTVARALLKVCLVLGAQVAPVALVAGGTWWLGSALWRSPSAGGPRLEEVHDG